ncbi:MAG TPA: hypothetical protein VLT33_35100 [Labilithrix sp.]|nr:hypothetical protein [Labilithrix sp.]
MHFDGTKWSRVRVNGIDSSDSFEAIWGTSATNLWLVGAKGRILHGDGKTFSIVTSPVAGAIHSVWGTSVSDVWASGANGTILRWGGAAWEVVNTGLGVSWDLTSITGSSPTDIWVAHGIAGNFVRYDGTWKIVDSGLSGALFSHVWAAGPNQVWAAGTKLALYNGAGWFDQSSDLESGVFQNIKAITGTSATDVWAVTSRGGVYHSTGTGSWSSRVPFDEPLVPDYLAIAPSATDTWLAGEGGRIQQYNAAKDKWSTPNKGTSTDIAAVALIGGDLLALGDFHGTFGASAPSAALLARSGTTWTETAGPPIEIDNGTGPFSPNVGSLFQAMWGTSASDLWVAGDNCALSHSSGGTWTALPTGGKCGELSGVWGSSATDVYAVGSSGTLVHWTNAGAPVVDKLPAAAGAALRAIWGTSASDIWVVGDGAFRYTNGAWSTIAMPGGVPSLYDVWGTSANDVWAIGFGVPASFATFHWNGASWTQLNVPAGIGALRSIHGTATNDVWVVGDRGYAAHWDGTKWSVEDTGTTQDLLRVRALSKGSVRAFGKGGAILRKGL